MNCIVLPVIASIHQIRAWECCQMLVAEFTERMGDDDLARIIDVAQKSPAALTDDDMDDIALMFDTYVERRI